MRRYGQANGRQDLKGRIAQGNTASNGGTSRSSFVQACSKAYHRAATGQSRGVIGQLPTPLRKSAQIRWLGACLKDASSATRPRPGLRAGLYEYAPKVITDCALMPRGGHVVPWVAARRAFREEMYSRLTAGSLAFRRYGVVPGSGGFLNGGLRRDWSMMLNSR